ncbi:uncharacterized protein N7484_008198 [Penicillium longicatenatum]|uniref:uncharacterized protein n=1 Tax=Penicillium longicatenatum TaxID=1561947 RepID=UPI002547F766|nr:uncharacterized protein N7484_008198 [Penicillium longicatenatum]KAJ5640336.1 hypothetical protein N7484_008198 [Penicillium longicatenatum]
MAYTTSYDGSNSGFQVGQNLGHITRQFLQPERSLNQECLRDLRTTDPHYDKDRIQNTNGGLLKDSYCWILDNKEFQQWQNDQSNCLLWIRGDPGKGKTMLLCGIIDELMRLFGDTANISFFFCQATDVRINNATAVLRGLIYSLVEKQVSLLSYVQRLYDKAGKALFEDTNAWNALSRIFTDILKDQTLQSTYLIIDALDECTSGLPSLLDLITQTSSAYPQVKWIVSSRNWPEIEERLDTTQTAPISLELNEASVSEAVSKFIQHKVHYLAKVKKYSEETRDTIYCHLSSNSQGTFLWVALVCQHLDRTSRRHALKKLEAFPPGLDALYSRMIDQVRNSDDAETCKRILAVMSIVYRPIAFDELASLIDLPDDLSDDSEALSEVIGVCGSFLTVREDTIIFVHQSAKEFLLKERQNVVFPRGIEAEHHTVFSRSLQAMSKTLRRDIFQLRLPGFPIEKVKSPSPNPLAAAEIWDPATGQCASILEGHGDSVNSIAWSQDGRRLASGSDDNTVRIWDPATGQCASILEGHGDSVNSIAWSQDGRRLASGSDDNTVRIWDPATGQCVSTLGGHSESVLSITWSQDGSRLASGSGDNTVRIWDPATGQCASSLEGHGNSVLSITWSQDGSRLASGSGDNTVRIWDPATGQYASILEGHSNRVLSIAWSQDGNRLASGSDDKTVRIWDPATGQCVSTLKGHSESVRSITWLQDGRLASGSYDNTVRIWDPATGQCASTLEGHNETVYSIAWSQDGSQLASGSGDNTVRIWDPATGQCALTLEGHSGLVLSIAWSQDGSRLASGSYDNTIRIWDPATGQCTSILEGHGDSVNSIAWSQDGRRLASGSDDNTVRIWDPATGQCASILEGHGDLVNSIAWSQDGRRLASGSDDNTVRIWDPATGQYASILEGHSNRVLSITWSQDGSRLASGSGDNTMAEAAECSERSIINLRNNLHQFGNIRAPPTRVGRRRSITPLMLEAICDHLLEESGLYVDEMALFLWDGFHIQVTKSSLKRALASVGWSKKVARQRAKEQNADLRDFYLHNLSDFRFYHLVYVDESGCDKRIGFRRTFAGFQIPS